MTCASATESGTLTPTRTLSHKTCCRMLCHLLWQARGSKNRTNDVALLLPVATGIPTDRPAMHFSHAAGNWLFSAGYSLSLRSMRLAFLGWWSAFLTQRATGSPRLVMRFPHAESDWLSSAGDLLSSCSEWLALLSWRTLSLTQRVTGS